MHEDDLPPNPQVRSVCLPAEEFLARPISPTDYPMHSKKAISVDWRLSSKY